MNTVERSFRLEAQSGLGAKPRPELIGPVLTHLHETLQDSVRMGFLHTSRAPGRVPGGIRAAADVRYVGHRADGDGATLLRFEVAPFGEAAAELFAQAQLWDDGPRPEETAFELLAAALEDVGSGRTESSRYDSGILRRIHSYRRLFHNERLDRISLPDVSAHPGARLDASVVQSARKLYEVTPDPRRVRVAGRLDLMGASQGILKVHLATGAIVTAIWAAQEPLEQFSSLFNREVVCEGTGIFRPSGTLLRVEADALGPAGNEDAFFRQVPVATPRTDIARAARLRAGEPSAYAGFFGSIPGEESDDEFTTAVEALS